MKELIIKVDDPGERVWDGSPKTFETQELIRCKDCKYNDDGECIIKAGWFPVKPDWFCADGERRSE